MALTPKNWALNAYTNNTWTNLVGEPAQVATVVISNTSSAAVTVQMKLDNGSGVELMKLLPLANIGVNEVYTFEMRSVNVTGVQKLQVQANGAGIGFLASGVV